MSTSRLKTIILRFRDLSIADTIFEHNKIIGENHFVWWGWWAKPQETIPFKEFGQLNSACKEVGLQVFLFDSGKRILYKAQCTEIVYKNAEKCGSPDATKTPPYYSTMEYMAWFKFENISAPLSGADATKELKNYSYYRVDDFFVSGHSTFAPFYNKRIYSIDELAEQQRTIWFIRDFDRGDKSHEIHSYSASMSNGKNVDTDFRLLSANSILWISDAHFSTDHHAFKVEHGNDNQLCIRLQKELERLSLTVSHVIISGDLTFRAQADEYSMAERFINDFNSIYNLNKACYSICPGNHDLRLSSTGYKEGEKVTVASDEAKECYTDFYRRIYGIEPTESLYSIKRLLTPDLVPVEIIIVNSVLLQQGEHFMGMGFVGNDQLNAIEKELSLTKDKPVIRILVMHHHLLPVMFSEKPAIDHMYSMMLDSEAISQFIIRNKINVVLHGHAHKEYYAEITREVEQIKHKYYILGTGSVGAIQEDLSDSRPNMFSTLSFSQSELIIEQYSLFPNGEASTKLHTYKIPTPEKR